MAPGKSQQALPLVAAEERNGHAVESPEGEARDQARVPGAGAHMQG